MNLRVKLLLLEVSIGFIVGVVLFLDQAWIPEEKIHLVYYARNLTYLDELNDAKVKMNDPLLINAIREKFLIPPSPRSTPYKLKDPHLFKITKRMGENIARMLKYKRNGFFVEARAFDGETHSNTLLLEHRLNWTGLLVEPDPIKVAKIVEKNRKAWVSPSCVSIVRHPRVKAVRQVLKPEKTWGFLEGPKRIGLTDVQCFPLYSLLLALNRTEVDYLSLSVKRDELEVLTTIPFDILNINMVSIECSYKQIGKATVQLYMHSRGYYLYEWMIHPDELSVVFIYFKQDEASKV